MQKEKQRDTVNIPILYCILLFGTYVTKSACFSGGYLHIRCLTEGWMKPFKYKWMLPKRENPIKTR